MPDPASYFPEVRQQGRDAILARLQDPDVVEAAAKAWSAVWWTETPALEAPRDPS